MENNNEDFRPDKDSYYLNIAKSISERSTCHYWKSGAVIVKKNGIIVGTGYCGSTSGSPHCKTTGVCPFESEYGIVPDGSQTNCLGVHAEINAMLRSDFESMNGATLYLYCVNRKTKEEIPLEPDGLTSRMLCNCGIKRIVTGRDSVE